MMDDTRVTLAAGDQTAETTVAAIKARTQELRRKLGKPPLKPDPTFDAAAHRIRRVVGQNRKPTLGKGSTP